jgi:hypothetical protein
MSDEKERRKILDGIKDKIRQYEQETDLEKAQSLWREIKSSIDPLRKYQNFGSIMMGPAVRAKMSKLKEFAQRCPSNNLEFRTDNDFCGLSAGVEEFNACEYQSESLGVGLTDKNYCKYCQYKPKSE